MWYIKSGALQGVSGRDALNEAFIELFDLWVAQTGHFPDLGVLGAASQESFDFAPHNSTFFITEWMLFNGKRIPKMSHEFESPQEHMASLFEKWPELDDALALVEHGQDEVLEADIIDAPNSREDFWDDIIDVPDDYKWATDNADTDASCSGS